MPEPENFEAVVIGSGFGGTILTLTLANKFEADNIANNTSKKVCVLERGQWWLSHEINYTLPERRGQSYKKNMREFLDVAKRPYHFWPHPDTVRGNIEIASAARDISKTGLYDYRVLGDNVHVIASSGVEGGSLVYSNVTLRPDDTVYANWPTQNVMDDQLNKKFSYKEVYDGRKTIHYSSFGIGRVVGKYKHRPDLTFHHTYPVEWFDTTEREIPPQKGTWVRTISKVSPDLYHEIITEISKNYLLIRHQPEFKRKKSEREYWSDKLGKEYHFGKNVVNYKK